MQQYCTEFYEYVITSRVSAFSKCSEVSVPDNCPAQQVKDNAGVGEADEPVRLVETEAGDEVARRVFPKGCVAKAAAAEVEEGCHEDGDH
jgi:hypothetical protein